MKTKEEVADALGSIITRYNILITEHALLYLNNQSGKIKKICYIFINNIITTDEYILLKHCKEEFGTKFYLSQLKIEEIDYSTNTTTILNQYLIKISGELLILKINPCWNEFGRYPSYRLIRKLWKTKEPVNWITLTEELAKYNHLYQFSFIEQNIVFTSKRTRTKIIIPMQNIIALNHEENMLILRRRDGSIFLFDTTFPFFRHLPGISLKFSFLESILFLINDITLYIKKRITI